VKSHFPVVSPNVGVANVSKAIVCIRNPIDTLMSYFEFKITYSQNKSCDPTLYKECKEEWEWFFIEHMIMWKQFYDYWVKIAIDKTIPVYFFRYEDLSTDPARIIKEIFEFTLEVDSLSGTYLEKRINDSVKKAKKPQFYKPRQGGINLNIHRYSDEQINMLKTTYRDHLNYFGYTKLPSKTN
jgi:hypothetical protein